MIARLIVASFGGSALFHYASTGFNDHFAAMTGMMFMMMAATNFCTQCPLLSSVQRMFGFGPSHSVKTDRL